MIQHYGIKKDEEKNSAEQVLVVMKAYKVQFQVTNMVNIDLSTLCDVRKFYVSNKISKICPLRLFQQLANISSS